MSFFNDKFLTEVSNYEYKKSYEKDSLVLYNNHIYIAKKDTNEEIIPETTTDDWEYISYEDCINIIANIGSFTGDSYLGTKKYPFRGTVLQNSIQILQKNKVNRPGYFSNIKFGKDIVDDNNATNFGVLYDTDNENPKLIAMTNVLNEVDLGTGQFCFNNIYSSSPTITISDDDKIASTKDINTNDLNVLEWLFLILLGNAVGAFGFGLLVYPFSFLGNQFSDTIHSIGSARETMNAFEMFGTSILCGILVYIAVYLFNNSKQHFGRITGILCPIALFVLAGFQHCVANMFYMAASGHWGLASTVALLVCIIGNSVGGLVANLPVLVINRK